MQSIEQIKLLQKQISELTNEQIREEIVKIKKQIKEMKPLLLGVIKHMKNIVLVRGMVEYIKELLEHIDSMHQLIIYMYYLSVEVFNRTKSPNYLLLVGKMLKISKNIIASFEDQRAGLPVGDIEKLAVMGLGSLIKGWQDTAHIMVDHQEIINTTIGKSNPTEEQKEYLFTINQLL